MGMIIFPNIFMMLCKIPPFRFLLYAFLLLFFHLLNIIGLLIEIYFIYNLYILFNYLWMKIIPKKLLKCS